MPIQRSRSRPNRVRQADVARGAGVSQATVSMVLGEGDLPGRTSPDTRRRVLEVAAALGYSVNPVARNLVGGRNRLIGVYTFEAVFPTEARDFYQEFFLGIEHEAELAGYDLLLFTSASLPGQRRSIYAGGVNRLSLSDGSILLGRSGDKRDIERLCGEGFPFVYVGRRDLPGTRMSYVTADYAAATAGVVHHLARLGHRRIAYLGTDSVSEPDLDRVEGWERAVDELGLTAQVRLLRARGQEFCCSTVAKLCQEGVTALVLENPQSAHEVFTTAHELGLVVPKDLSIAVLGDDPSRPPGGTRWTGFRIPREAMGRSAVALLLNALENPDAGPRSTTLACAFEPGDTVSFPRPASSADKREPS